ncbi:MAG: AarF/ABC1/UbiB kinase family protein [Candidatus Thermoplasmatota archaeon]|nr:AarF/ABC1/UbiB kinase family protein [Candidatus Thermoplasmatota archaeon]MBS3790924.1 AarF/ABC1/UbiB kinase family protein [Candidatus Thermoplasmatota archaeon]
MKRTTKIQRIRELVSILREHGFQNFIRELGLTSFLSRSKMEERVESKMQDVKAHELRELFEDLGPAFIKLGQFLGMRPDILPPHFAKELQKLHDEAKPFPGEKAREIIKNELEYDLDEIFEEFYNEPIASASIGQVHEATLKNGKEVVVKVQRPGIEEDVQADLELIERFTRILEDVYPESEMYQPHEVTKEFKKMLESELDYTVEARNAQRFYNAFEEEPDIKIPKIYWDYLTKRVLIMENVEGKSMRTLIDGDYPDEFKREIAENFARNMMRQFFIHGIFHADPSPGNIHFCEEDGSLVLLDFGAIGRFNEEMRNKLIDIFIGMFENDIEKVKNILLDIGEIHGEYDEENLKWDIENVLQLYRNKPDLMLKEGLDNEIMDIVRTHNITLPVDFLLMERAIAETEGICTTLDPDFDFFKASEPVMEEIVIERYHPKKQIKNVFDSVNNYRKLFMDFPDRANNVLDNLEKGELKIDIELTGLEDMEERLDSISNRLSYTILAASIIIGSALIVLSGQQQSLGPYIFLISILIGVWLIYTIIKEGGY